MPNGYFKFKEFTIHQDRSAMKVTTDACLFGAWIASLPVAKIDRILDIGAGTGLLMLMLAQKSSAFILGVEADQDAHGQCVENIRASAWKERVEVSFADIRHFKTNDRFGLIVSNPPFHENQLTGNDQKKNLAHHSTMLDFKQLLISVSEFLDAGGHFAVLIPAYRSAELKALAATFHLFTQKELSVKQTSGHSAFRSMLIFSHRPVSAVLNDEIIIADAPGQYTPDFISLLKDYYLNL